MKPVHVGVLLAGLTIGTVAFLAVEPGETDERSDEDAGAVPRTFVELDLPPRRPPEQEGEDPPPPPPDPEPEAPAGPVAYVLATDESLLYVLVRKDPETLGSGLSHDHVVRAASWKGSVTVDPADLSTAVVAFEIQVAELVADEPEMRERVGYDSSLSRRDRSQTQRNMLKANQLDAENHPTIAFRSTAARVEEGRLTIEGDLTIRGRTKRVTVPIDHRLTAEELQARGRFVVSHADFGMKPYSAMLGAMKNGEEIEFVLEVRGRPAATDE